MTRIILTIFLAVITAIIVSRLSVKRWGGNFVKLSMVGSILAALAALSSMIFHGFGIENIRTILLFGLFFYASYGDIKTHEADDLIHVLVLIVAVIATPIETIPVRIFVAIILGGIMVFATVLLSGTGIGGADIKFTAACAFLTSMEATVCGFALGTLFAFLCNSPFRKKGNKGFAMLPYLSCGFMFVYLLF